jgi:hypothetical protein
MTTRLDAYPDEDDFELEPDFAVDGTFEAAEETVVLTEDAPALPAQKKRKVSSTKAPEASTKKVSFCPV